MSETKISAEELRSFSQQIFEAAGVTSTDAEYATDVLIWASLRGVDTHGIRNLKRYYIDTAGGVGRRDGVICFDAELTTEFDSLQACCHAIGQHFVSWKTPNLCRTMFCTICNHKMSNIQCSSSFA